MAWEGLVRIGEACDRHKEATIHEGQGGYIVSVGDASIGIFARRVRWKRK